MFEVDVESLPPWKRAIVEKKRKEAEQKAKEEEEKRKGEEAKWKVREILSRINKARCLTLGLGRGGSLP